MLFQRFSLHTFQLWLAAFQWSMSAKRAERIAKIPRCQLFRCPLTCVSYTAFKRAGGQGNLFPVERVSAVLSEPLGFLSACWLASHMQAWESKGTPLLGVHHPRYLTHREEHQISFLLLAMPYIISAQSTPSLPSLLLLGQWWLICTLMEVPEA